MKVKDFMQEHKNERVHLHMPMQVLFVTIV